MVMLSDTTIARLTGTLDVLGIRHDVQQRWFDRTNLRNPFALNFIHFVTMANVQNLDKRVGLEVQARTQPHVQVAALPAPCRAEMLLKSTDGVTRTANVTDAVGAPINERINENLFAVRVQRMIGRVQRWKHQWGRLIAHRTIPSFVAMLRAGATVPGLSVAHNFTSLAMQ